MNIVYTYCQIDKLKPISDITMKLATLAVGSMKKHTKNNTILYTDCREDFEHLPFDDIIDVDFFDWNWDRRYWNIPKLKTYTLQRKPFLHVDLDIFVMPTFKVDDGFDLYSENIRMLEKTQAPYKHYPKELSNGCVMCSGILGGATDKAYRMFDLMYEKAQQECVEDLSQEVVFDDLYSLEENWSYHYALDNDLSIQQMKIGTFLHFAGFDKEIRFGRTVSDILILYDLEKYLR